MRASILIAPLALLATPAAADDTFEAKAAGAEKVEHLDDLVWAVTDKCDRPDDVLARQCKNLRDGKLARFTVGSPAVGSPAVGSPNGTGKPLLLDGPALAVGPWNAAKKSADVSISSTLLDMKTGAIAVLGTSTKPVVARALPFDTAAARDAFEASIAGARTHVVVTLAAIQKIDKGVAVDVVAYRVVTPCDGKIVLSAPASSPIAADPKVCPKKK